MIVAVGLYLYYAEVEGSGGISVVFLLLLPACLSAFLGLLIGRGRDWSFWNYMLVPLAITGIAVLIGAVFLREGVICLVLLSPLWMLSGAIGASLAYALRPASPPDEDLVMRETFRAAGWLALPIAALAIEPLIPITSDWYTVENSIVIDARPADIWPHLESIPAIEDSEGTVNATQNLLRVPRPVDARLAGRGVGAIRHARWQDGIGFEEHITRWDPDRTLSWDFIFPDESIRHRTDRHIDPDAEHLTVESGGYRIEPLANGQSRLTLWTRYRLTTHVNSYAALWGGFLLSDIQGNILSIVRRRAER